MLFQFNDSMIDALAQGDIDERLAESFGEIADVVKDELGKRSDEEFEIEWADDGVYVGLTEEQAAAEFGGSGTWKPVVRPALLAAKFDAEKAGAINA